MVYAPPNKEDIPKFWHLLDDGDKKEYFSLFSLIKDNNPESKLKKNRINSFTETVDLIRKYAIRGDKNDIARSIICGILWLGDSIAINSHRLGFLMSKCKSSINGSLQMLGYKEITSKKQASEIVREKILAVTNDKNEIRKWTIRSICKSEGQNNENKKETAPNLPKTVQNNDFIMAPILPKAINQQPHILPVRILKPEEVIQPVTNNFFLISTSPIEPISQPDNKYFKKEDITINVGFQSNSNEKLQNNDLTDTDVFFY